MRRNGTGLARVMNFTSDGTECPVADGIGVIYWGGGRMSTAVVIADEGGRTAPCPIPMEEIGTPFRGLFRA